MPANEIEGTLRQRLGLPLPPVYHKYTGVERRGVRGGKLLPAVMKTPIASKGAKADVSDGGKRMSIQVVIVQLSDVQIDHQVSIEVD